MTNAYLVPLSKSYVLPALIADAGDKAALRFLEFFTVNIRNPNTRAAAAVASAALVWNVIEQDLPALKKKVTAILEAGPPQGS